MFCFREAQVIHLRPTFCLKLNTQENKILLQPRINSYNTRRLRYKSCMATQSRCSILSIKNVQINPNSMKMCPIKVCTKMFDCVSLIIGLLRNHILYYVGTLK